MKKFIIAICGVMLAGGAMGRTYSHPHIIDITNQWVKDSWGWYDGLYYDTDVSENISPTDFYNTKAGTFGTNNEGSIIPVIARNIYAHGGNFSMTQMQAAWTNKIGTGQPRWIDFFNQKEYLSQVVCEPGWSGKMCQNQKYDCSNLGIDYTRDLNNPLDGSGQTGYRILEGEENGIITNGMSVFDYLDGYKGSRDNLPDGNFSDSTTNDHYSVVLAVIGIKRHAIIVAPTKVNANEQTIKNAYSNKHYYKLLCAPGYEANEAGDDCVLHNECRQDYMRFCNGFNENDFEESQHAEVINTQDKCRYFVCKEGSDYAFRPGTVECMKCERTRYQGINASNECEQCGQGELFMSQDQGCRKPGPSNILTTQQLIHGIRGLFNCWMEKHPFDYATCVKCKEPDDFNSITKTCGPRGTNN